MRLEVLRHRQEQAHTCLPACLRIVLHYLGRDYPERELSALCGTRRLGTTVNGALAALDVLECEAVYFDRGGLDDLAAYLGDDRPVIALLRLEALASGVRGAHAVVVCGLVGEGVAFLDPSSGTVAHLSPDDFLRAWWRHGGEGIVVLDVG
jgi:ABC-type bacteriocin/lantibiotic exporter with double-glycine peptidase domain